MSRSAPSDPQLDAGLVELTELGPEGADRARHQLQQWHAAHDLGARLLERVIAPALGHRARVAAAELLVSWGDAHAPAALDALADTGDPTLVDAAIELSELGTRSPDGP